MFQNANKLRIGNNVNYTVAGSKKHIGEITLIAKTEDGLRVIIDHHYPLSFGEPIIITKDVLFSLGAKQFPDGESLELCGRLIGFVECRNVFFDKPTGVELKTVHETQNLFYDLTGQELSLRPPSSR